MPNHVKLVFLCAALLGLTGALAGAADSGLERIAPVPGTVLYLISPSAGEQVSSPFSVRFGLKGMGIAPAGVDHSATGHHHLVIDAPLPPLDQAIPSSDQYRHFGGGQTETVLALDPGKHTLQLILGDWRHVPFDPPVVSEQIDIEVK